MITTVLIDIDDTILDFRKSASAAIRNMFAENGYRCPENVMKIYYDVSGPLWEKVERKEMTGRELRAIRWKLIFEQLNMDADSAFFEKQYPSYLSRQSPLIKDADKAVKYLSSKYTLCAASNAVKGQQEPRLEAVGLLGCFKKVFASDALGYDKPNPKFFDLCIQKLGNVKRDEIIMIGDSLYADVGGAKAAGIKSCWINLNGKPDTIGANYCVSSIGEVMNIL